MTRDRPPGRFVSFEGGEGAGKSTQIDLLAGTLRARGVPVAQTREPGGSPGAERIRELLVTGAVDRWSGLTETLLHCAARRDHLERTILPALRDGAWVLTDRFVDSTRVYQGSGRGVPSDVIETLSRITIDDVAPDLTIVLDVPVALGLARATARSPSAPLGRAEDRYERMDERFHERIRAGFLERASLAPERYAVVPADRPVDDVSAGVWAAVVTRFPFLEAGS